MPRRQRLFTYAIVGSLWLSGALWLLLDQYFAGRGDFGSTPHPLAEPLLLVHGVLAVVSMYLFGWISARHVSKWWRARRRRISGGVLTATLTVLTCSGFALFFLVDQTSQRIAVLVHDVLGLAVFGCLLQHWLLRKKKGDGR